MAPAGKGVSVGEYDPVAGLTHITHQRGRLLFNMGASAKKRQRREPGAPAAAVKPTPRPQPSTGTFTGLSLYPEEANYLLQRGALTVRLMSSEGEDAKELNVADFTAILASDTRVSLACMEVYTFLKDQKLHPRRCLEPLTVSTISSTEDGRSVLRHFKEGESCDVAFDVWKTVAVDVAPPEVNAVQATESSLPVVATCTGKAKKQKQRKKLMLVFRVAVYRYGDVAPGPRSFRQDIERSKARDWHESAVASSTTCSKPLACDQVPVKLAVVHHDQSVLLFEINSNIPTESK